MMPRKLAKARPEAVRRLNAVWDEVIRRYGDAYTNGAVARACGVHEKTVRQWRDGKKPLRFEAIILLPSRLRDEVIALIKILATQKKAMGQ